MSGNWLVVLAALVLSLTVAGGIYAHRLARQARAADARWEALPSIYAMEDLRRMYLQHVELVDAGLLDPGQPTEWSHAAHRIWRHGSRKDRTLLYMSAQQEGWLDDA